MGDDARPFTPIYPNKYPLSADLIKPSENDATNEEGTSSQQPPLDVIPKEELALSADDIEYLTKWINPAFLIEPAMAKVQQYPLFNTYTRTP